MEGKLILTNDEERNEQVFLLRKSKKKYPNRGKYYLSEIFVEKIYNYKQVKLLFKYNEINYSFNFIYLPANENSSYSVEVLKKSSYCSMCATMNIDSGNLTDIIIRVY
jgi:hypothetical protein